MQKTPICDNWRFRKLDDAGAWTKVRLPHDAMIRETRTEQSAGGINTGWFEGFDYEYERLLDIPDSRRGSPVILECEGVYHNAEVWLNGEKLAFRPYGYTNFYVDLSDHLQYGSENLLRIIARNADQPNSRWYSGAGLYRPVNLWTAQSAAYLPPNAIKVRTISVDPAKIEVTVQTVGAGPVQILISRGERVLGSVTKDSNGIASAVIEIAHAKLWSPQSPELYRCQVSFADDTAETTFGIRTLAWNAEQGLTINGRREILRGACIHHDNGILGAACFPEAVERKVRLLRENGYNAIRSAHNPCSKTLLEVCDRLGMLVMDEYIDHWYIHKTQHDYVSYFPDWWQQDLSDMVEKDYNHPSVILYSTGNEVSETALKKGIALTKELTDYLHQLDPTRPVTCSVNIFFNFLSSVGFGVYSDEKSKKEAVQAEKRRQAGKAEKKKKAVGSQFFNDLAGLMGDNFMKAGATLHGCDVKTRGAFANMDIAGYNYGIFRYQHDLKKYPERLILGSETFCSDAYAFWEMAQQEPRLIGDFVWAGMDYLGEVGVGSWEYRDYAPDFDHGPGWITAGSGRIDLTGHPLAEASYTKVAFGLTEGPVIAVRPVNHTHDKHSPSAWKMTNAIESWSWHGCEGEDADVEVYTRAPFVELFLNGRSCGKKKRGKNCIVCFRIKYEPGELTAVALDQQGNETAGASLTTAGNETILHAIPEQEIVKPGQLCYVNLIYSDAEGQVKPLERHRIHVCVENGTLLALGNACPYNAEGYGHDYTDTYWGRALAVVRADGAGPLTLTADDGVRTHTAIVPVVD